MKQEALSLLLQALEPHADLRALDASRWDVIVRLARSADLLARLAQRVQAQGAMDEVPPEVAMHLRSAALLAHRQHRELELELALLDRLLAAEQLPVVVLKGAAYVMAGLDAAAGRMVSDVDLMVPKAQLAQAESALMMAGWISAKRDDYDQRYYRTWMHEIPPMQHIHRGTVIDLHHNILPPSGRHAPDASMLLRSARTWHPYSCLRTLGPEDMVLHSATHLAHEGEVDLGLRGVVDLDALLREFSAEDGFFPRLLARAEATGLERPLWQMLGQAMHFLDTPVPPDFMSALTDASGLRSMEWQQRLLANCWWAALPPRHPLLHNAWAPAARGILYLRGHWLRMPPHLLAKHLARKGVRAILSPEKRRETA